MRLNELLKYDDIVIQCHDNPDADALASGYALYWYFTKMNKKPSFIYRGKNQVSKSNLTIMLDELAVPVTYKPTFKKKPELLITVDCQYGERNVTTTPAANVAIIDHHRPASEIPEMSEVRSNIGSCATVVWDMIKNENLDPNEDKLLSTALYYGLYTDTNRLSEVSHPLDRDMIDSLEINKSLITKMSNSNISLKELEITGRAIETYEYYPNERYLLIHSDPCDPNILGVMSDFALETAEVDVCVAYYVSETEVKFSVRSCIKEVHADELASFIADELGGGGGHMYKAGGMLHPLRLLTLSDNMDLDSIADAVIRLRIKDYCDKYQIIYAKDATLDTSLMQLYEKADNVLGTVHLKDVFPVGSTVEIRTLEGDVNVKIEEDTFLMIGVEGEVYPIKQEKLERSYKFLDKPYERTFDYEPSIKDLASGERKGVLAYTKSVLSSGGSRIYAGPVDGYIKLFTLWDEEKYYSANPGDYIAVREDDPHDIYIIRNRLFDTLYKPVN